MPTNFIQRRRPASKAATEQPTQRQSTNIRGQTQRLQLVAGPVVLEIETLATPTATVILQALPLFAVAEPWGASLHFKVPLESGRDRSARINGALGDVYLWDQEDRILIPFGPTPISRPGEIRLPAPCNRWARVAGDVTLLRSVKPGAKVTLQRTP
jgi:uncharacterized protein